MVYTDTTYLDTLSEDKTVVLSRLERRGNLVPLDYGTNDPAAPIHLLRQLASAVISATFACKLSWPGSSVPSVLALQRGTDCPCFCLIFYVSDFSPFPFRFVLLFSFSFHLAPSIPQDPWRTRFSTPVLDDPRPRFFLPTSSRIEAPL